MEWSDLVLLFDAASRELAVAACLRNACSQAAEGNAQEAEACLDALRCRTNGRRRRLLRAMSQQRSAAELLVALTPKEAMDASACTLVCTHHKEDYNWALPLVDRMAQTHAQPSQCELTLSPHYPPGAYALACTLSVRSHEALVPARLLA